MNGMRLNSAMIQIKVIDILFTIHSPNTMNYSL